MVALYSGQSGQNGHFPGRAKIFFQIASVPTVIFARYLPSFCFAILLPLPSFCFLTLPTAKAGGFSVQRP